MHVQRLPFVEVPMGSGVQLGLGEGPIKKVGPMSQPRGTFDTALCTLYHTHALNVHFLKQLYSRQLRMSCILMWRYSDTPGPLG